MTLFVSYTKADDAVVRTIRADLEQLGHDVWMDHQIHGGESWWREIIREIQGARVFVFALSNNSWKSKPCRLELDYANDLGIPVLPLQVGPLDHMYIPLAEKQIIDFRTRSADGVVKLVTALAEMINRPVTLPDPLPEPPPVPFEYLYRIASVMGPNRITPERQEELIGTLRRKLREEDDLLARVDIVKLLHELKDRNEITVPNARDIDEILAGVTPGPTPEDGATRLPPADHWRKVPLPTPPPSTRDGGGSAPTGSATVEGGGPVPGEVPGPAAGTVSGQRTEVSGSATGPTSESAGSGARTAPGPASGPAGRTAAGAAPESGAGGGPGSGRRSGPGTGMGPAAASGPPTGAVGPPLVSPPTPRAARGSESGGRSGRGTGAMGSGSSGRTAAGSPRGSVPESEAVGDSGAGWRFGSGTGATATGPSTRSAAGPEAGATGRSWPVPGSGPGPAPGAPASAASGTGAGAGAETGAAAGSAPAGGVWPGAGGGTRPEAGESAEAKPEGGAPEWLADLMRAEPGRRPSRAVRGSAESGAPQGSEWWTRQNPVPGQNPVPAVESQQVWPAEGEQGRRFGLLGIGLGVVGVLFLVVGLAAGESARVSLLAVVALLVGVLGMSVGVVSVARQEPRARVAAVVAAVGLVGAIGYAIATWA